jgi:hypothetical protein
MGGIKGFFDSFKELLWDIIGYLIPGSYLLILLSVCINERLFLSSKINIPESELSTFAFVIVAYLLGHVVYGFSFFKEKRRGVKSYTKKIEESIMNKKSIVWSKQILKSKFEKLNISEDFSQTSVRDLRNIVMSFIPESDQKIYTFTFRADISNNTANISLIVGVFGLVFSFIQLIFSEFLFFNLGTEYYLLYSLLIIVSFFLKETRNRFYAISIGVPFSIFTAKNLN